MIKGKYKKKWQITQFHDKQLNKSWKLQMGKNNIKRKSQIKIIRRLD